MEHQNRKIAVIGAGISGLLACKYATRMGFDVVVFEASSTIGGVWSKTIESTKLQTPKNLYQFSDFPWPSHVTETFPDHKTVVEYVTSYAKHFQMLDKIKFKCRVSEIEYVCGDNSDDDDDETTLLGWECWGGTGEAFSKRGKWNVIVQDSTIPCTSKEVHQVDFVILCIGMFSDLPNIPDFPLNEGPEVFDGKVLHSMDYASMDPCLAAEFIKDKRVTVVGFQKSAIDIATEIASKNGARYPCTLLFRRARWALPDFLIKFTLRNFNRFTEFMFHKPGEGFFLWIVAVLLSPLVRIFTKLLECYLKWMYPLKKYNMVPEMSLLEQVASTMTPTLPANFYDAVDEGSIILRRSDSFGFCKSGLLVNGDSRPLEADIVIFATGYQSDEKLKNIFASTYFQKCIIGSSAPLYRECIHPRIPQLAILGYADSPSVLYTTEMRSKWLAYFLSGKFKLSPIKEMEAEAVGWERCMRLYHGDGYKRYRISVSLQIFCNDQLCRDMKCNPRRKNSLLTELFAPYGPTDYQNLVQCDL